MKNRIFILSTLFLIGACSAPKVEESEESKEAELAIQLTAEQMEYNHIKTGKLEKGAVFHTVKATGMIDVPPNFALKLSSPIEAYVSKIMVLPGDRVTKGQVVGYLTHPSIASTQQDYLSTKARLEFVSADLARKADLLAGKAVSQREYDQLKSEEVNLKSQMKSLDAEMSRLGINKSKLNSENVSQTIPLTAPIAGVITDLFTKTGEFVSTSNPILSILNREHEHVELQVFQNDLAKVMKGMEVRLKLPGSEAKYEGEVFLINTQLNSETLSANVHVHPHGDFPHLPINAVVFGEIIYQTDSGYVLPKSEIIKEGASTFIFVNGANGFEKQAVEVGFDDGVNIQITGPQTIFNQEVVLEGNYYLNGV